MTGIQSKPRTATRILIAIGCALALALMAAAPAGAAYTFVSSWGSSGSGTGQFNFPTGIATDAAGHVFVSDTNNFRVQRFDSSGAFQLAWGSPGTTHGKFDGNWGLATDSAGNVYAADKNNQRVEQFSGTGTYAATFGSGAQLAQNFGVAVDAAGNVYTADTFGSRIAKYDSAGTFLGYIATSGSGDGQVVQPFGLAIDANGNVVVADYGNNRIQVLSPTGAFVTKWGTAGSGDGQFNRPVDVAVDALGQVVVADNGNSRFQVFTATGTFVQSVTGGFNQPYGIAADASGNVYLVDSGNHRVLKFSMPLPTADLALTKTASKSSVRHGSHVTYTLTVHNNGSDDAGGATVSDTLPAGVAFVSADPGCSFAAGTVTCTYGPIAAGDSAQLRFVVKVTAPRPPRGNHLLTVSKAEQQVDLNAGQTRTVSLTCPNGGDLMTDGGARVDSVDQGTGTLASVDVLEAKSVAKDTYEFTLRNNATGRAQTKVFGVCVSKQTTNGANHAHSLVVSALNTEDASGGPGSVSRTVGCPSGQVAVSPSFLFTAGSGSAQTFTPSADLSSWTFGFDLPAPGTVQVGVRCLDDYLSVASGHTHQLKVDEVTRTVNVPANSTITASVTCADDAKGIVASYDLPDGVRMLGHDPQPKTRVFRLLNTTGSDKTATLDLVCLHDRTSGGKVPIANSATVSLQGGTDPNPANDTSSATIVVHR